MRLYLVTMAVLVSVILLVGLQVAASLGQLVSGL